MYVCMGVYMCYVVCVGLEAAQSLFPYLHDYSTSLSFSLCISLSLSLFLIFSR